MALGGISRACRIGGDVLNEMLIHAMSNADAYERLVVLEQVLAKKYNSSYIVYKGFLKAKEDALDYINKDCNQFKVAINNMRVHLKMKKTFTFITKHGTILAEVFLPPGHFNLVTNFLGEDRYLVSKFFNTSFTMAVFSRIIPSRLSKNRAGTPSMVSVITIIHGYVFMINHGTA